MNSMQSSNVGKILQHVTSEKRFLCFASINKEREGNVFNELKISSYFLCYSIIAVIAVNLVSTMFL